MESLQEGFELARQGGWPMIPLGLCAIAAMTVIIERGLTLRRKKIVPESLADLASRYAGEASADDTLRACRQSASSLARIIESLVLARKQSRGQLAEALNVTGRREVERLERGLMALEIVAATSPLLGLLGTVLGMVTVFNAINAEGLGNAQVLSGGISEALITTVTGLIVAIPALAFYSYFSKRVESLANELQEIGTLFIARLVDGQRGATASDAAPDVGAARVIK